MGTEAKKKSIAKNLRKASAQFSASKDDSPDFVPLEGGPARKIPKIEERENKATVLYIGRIPHGFYENEMEGFFKQFGTIKRLRIGRNRKTGKSRHFGFIEFESPEVAKVVSECMHNYLLFEHLLQVQLVPPERVHPKLWKGVTHRYKPLDWVKIDRSHHDKERTLEEHKKLVERIMKGTREGERGLRSLVLIMIVQKLLETSPPQGRLGLMQSRLCTGNRKYALFDIEHVFLSATGFLCSTSSACLVSSKLERAEV